MKAPFQPGAVQRSELDRSALRSPSARMRPLVPWLRLGALTAAASLVFWLFDSLPFQDLPAHAGLIALRHRFDASPFEQRFFVFAPHIGPYSLFRALGDVLVVPLGPIGAIRAIATLPVVATPLALLWARRRLHGDDSTTAAYFGLALGFGFMTLLGFASYLLGVAVLIAVFTVWLELMFDADSERPAIKREAAIACLAPCVLVAHGDAFVIFIALAGVTALATGHRPRRAMRLRALGPSIGLATWVAWRERASSIPPGSVATRHAAFALHFQSVSDKLSLLVTPTLLTRTGIDTAVGVFIWAVVGGGVIATARALRRPSDLAEPLRQKDLASRAHSRALLASFVALAVAFLALPHSIGWFGFVDGRLVPLLLLVGLMAIRRPALGRLLVRAFDDGAPIAASIVVAVAIVASHFFQREARGWHEVIDAVPASTRLLNLPVDPSSAIFTAHPFVHYDKLIVADRPTVVSDVWFHQGSALYPTGANPALRLPDSYSESDLRFVDWPAYHLADWDYVLVRTRPEASAPLVPPELTLAIHRGGWWLYKTMRLASLRPAP